MTENKIIEITFEDAIRMYADCKGNSMEKCMNCPLQKESDLCEQLWELHQEWDLTRKCGGC